MPAQGPKKRRDRSRRPNGPTPSRSGADSPRARAVPPAVSLSPEEQPLILGLDEVLRDGHPLDLITFASTMVSTLDVGDVNPFARLGRPARDRPSLDELVESFLEVGLRQTDALLLVLSNFVEPGKAMRIRTAVAARRHPLPGWLLRLDQVRPVKTVEIGHVLGDGDNIVIGVELPGGKACTIFVYIDHNLGTLVKDAFVLDLSFAEAIAAWSRVDDDASDIRELSLADARARVTEAIESGRMTFPPYETETWPAIRPFVEWMLRLMPTGGTGYDRPEWSDRELKKLARQFFASKHASALTGVDDRDILGTLFWYGAEYGPGDPLRWSPVAVELLLVDWVPRKIMADLAYLERIPTVLRALIGFAHEVRAIPPALTVETLAAVDHFEPAYLEEIRDGGPDDDEFFDDEDGLTLEEYFLERLAEEVGGFDTLDTLDLQPLPPEPFDADRLPMDARGPATRVAELIATCAETLFDAEFRTAAYRVLLAASIANPQLVQRGRPETAAAAVCWIVGKANWSFDGRVEVQAMMAHFGLKGSPSQRAETVLRALGLNWYAYSPTLRDAAYLTSQRRRTIAANRDRYRAAAALD